MHKFDYRFLEKGLLPANFFTLASTIGAFKALSGERLRSYPVVYKELEGLARVQSVKESNAIEGIVTTDERIRAIVNGNSAPLNHSEAEIAGYRDALDMIHQRYNEIPFREETVLDLHRVIYRQTEDAFGGQYKKDDNLVVAYDQYGGGHVRFRPVSAKETAYAMEQLVLAYVDARDNAQINQLLLIPCVILDFLCIHPVSDGNGRLSRLLSLLLLYKNGYDIGRFVSFEHQINLSRDYYYQTLQESSTGWHTNENSYIPFMENFLSTLYKCYKELDKRFSVVNGKKLSKGARIEQTILNSILPMSKAEVCEALSDVSPTTVESVLGKMVKSGTLKKLGQGTATKYVNAKYIREE